MSKKTKTLARKKISKRSAEIIKTGTRFKDSKGRIYVRSRDNSTVIRIY